MALSFINVANSAQYNTGNIVCNKPTNTTEGDIMFAMVVNYAKGSTPEAGWNTLQSKSASSFNYVLYWKVAGASEPSSYTWTVSSSSSTSPNQASIATFRGGFNPSNPIDTSNSGFTATSDTSFSAGAITVAAANSYLIYMATGDPTNDSYTWTVPSAPTSSWTEHFEAMIVASYNKIDWMSQLWSSSGSTGTVSATSNGNMSSRFAVVLALNPAPLGPTNLKSYNTNLKANIKTINTNLIANVKSLNTNV